MNKIIYILFISINLFSQESLVNYDVKNVNINTKYSEFGTSYYTKNQIVYSALNKRGNLDLYVANETSDGLANSKVFAKELNSYSNESNVTFTKNKKVIYFTRSIYGQKNTLKKSKKAKIGIFRSTLQKDETWSEPKSLPFNSSHYDVAHPTLSKDDKMLFFTSNMPRTLGDNDIFVVDIIDGIFYSKPRNLGKNVNTPKKEMFPYVATDGFLYFASNDYKEGFGGLDIYYVKVNGTKVSKKVHLEAPINSKYDDFCYIFNPNKRTGFLSSNRQNGKGADDIYFVKEKNKQESEFVEESYQFIEKKECKQFVTGTVYKKGTTNVVSGATIILKDQNNKKIKEKVLKSNARYRFYLDCNKKYSISAKRDDFKMNTISVITDNLGEKRVADIYLTMKSEVIVYETVTGKIMFDINNNRLLPEDMYKLDKAIIMLRHNAKAKIYIESHTDSRGDDDFNMELTKKRVERIRNFILNSDIKDERIIVKAYGETKPLNKCTNKVKCTNKEYLKNRRTIYQVK